MSDTETNITGDVHGPVYSGNIGHIGDRTVNTGGGNYYEGGTHHHYPQPLRIPDQSPRRVEHFVDRTTELADLVANVQPGCVLTLTGPGGMGKTALVAEAIHRMAEENALITRFPDGIVFHDFYIEPAADQALSHIARTYNEPIDKEGIQSAARRALSGRTALLLLDGTENCDHLDRVIAVAGHCCVIITTHRLSDASAATTELPPLPENDAVNLIAQWAEINVDEPPAPNNASNTANPSTVPSLPPSSANAGRDREGFSLTSAPFYGYIRALPKPQSNTVHTTESFNIQEAKKRKPAVQVNPYITWQQTDDETDGD